MHSSLGITSIYLQGIDNAEIIDTVYARRAPMVQSTPSHAAERERPAPGRALVLAEGVAERWVSPAG